MDFLQDGSLEDGLLPFYNKVLFITRLCYAFLSLEQKGWTNPYRTNIISLIKILVSILHNITESLNVKYVQWIPYSLIFYLFNPGREWQLPNDTKRNTERGSTWLLYNNFMWRGFLTQQLSFRWSSLTWRVSFDAKTVNCSRMLNPLIYLDPALRIES